MRKLTSKQKYWIMMGVWIVIVQIWNMFNQWGDIVYWLVLMPGIALFFILPRRWKKQEEEAQKKEAAKKEDEDAEYDEKLREFNQ